jgi:hypothetical protein
MLCVNQVSGIYNVVRMKMMITSRIIGMMKRRKRRRKIMLYQNLNLKKRRLLLKR